jgi:hypothetical protein
VKSRIVKKDSLVSVSGADSVEFRAVVQKSLAIRNFEGIAIEPEGLAAGFAVTSDLPGGSLRIRSSTTDITGFSPQVGILFVDLSSVRKAGTYQLKVQARSPEGFTIERFEPQTVSVTVGESGR